MPVKTDLKERFMIIEISDSFFLTSQYKEGFSLC